MRLVGSLSLQKASKYVNALATAATGIPPVMADASVCLAAFSFCFNSSASTSFLDDIVFTFLLTLYFFP